MAANEINEGFNLDYQKRKLKCINLTPSNLKIEVVYPKTVTHTLWYEGSQYSRTETVFLALADSADAIEKGVSPLIKIEGVFKSSEAVITGDVYTDGNISFIAISSTELKIVSNPVESLNTNFDVFKAHSTFSEL